MGAIVNRNDDAQRTAARVVNPAFADVVNLWWVDSPMVVFEIAVSLWLVIKGLPAPAARPA